MTSCPAYSVIATRATYTIRAISAICVICATSEPIQGIFRCRFSCKGDDLNKCKDIGPEKHIPIGVNPRQPLTNLI